MMKKWIGPSLLAAVIAAALLPGCGGPSIPVAAPTSTANLVFGCNWSFESTAQSANFAYPDTNAVYWVAAVPDSIPSGDKIEISGTSATAGVRVGWGKLERKGSVSSPEAPGAE